jgi:hypothetical protein
MFHFLFGVASKRELRLIVIRILVVLILIVLTGFAILKRQESLAALGFWTTVITFIWLYVSQLRVRSNEIKTAKSADDTDSVKSKMD